MKKLHVIIFLISALYCNAQNYKYIGVENGLSSKKVYAIQKDSMGYMWFLTYEGIDRYNGKEIKHYNPIHNGRVINTPEDFNWLYTDHKGTLWQIGKKGKVFKYNYLRDSFDFQYQLPEQSNEDDPAPVTYSFIDNNHTIWLCGNKLIYLFNPDSRNTTYLQNNLNKTITAIYQYDNTHFFIGTDSGVYHAKLQNDKFKVIPHTSIKNLRTRINELYYDTASQQLVIGTYRKGIHIFNTQTEECNRVSGIAEGATITRIKPLNDKELLIATDNAEIYKLDITTRQSTLYPISYLSNSAIADENIVNDIYIDNEKRIWIAHYPIGITVCDDRYPQYQHYTYSDKNKQSLVNNEVNAIIEDYEGDLWFATNNGISLYMPRKMEWKSFLNAPNNAFSSDDHIFLSICEVTPGVIYTAGYSPDVYKIDKKSLKTSVLSLEQYKKPIFKPEKYIRSIVKDKQGQIWIGGYHNLKCLDEKKQEIYLYPRLDNITVMLDKDKESIWIGTGKGLYLLNKKTGDPQKIAPTKESAHIYSLCQAPNKSLLYIGTNGLGLLEYNLLNEKITAFNKDNNALPANNVYTILYDKADNLRLSSENGLIRFLLKDYKFHSWTKKQGIPTDHLNPNSGTLCSDNKPIFGSCEGAIKINRGIELPQEYTPKIVLSDFKIFYEPTQPDDENSPLQQNINDTPILKLNHNQNIFSIKVSCIDYDNPSNILFSWRLKGFYNTWSIPSREHIMQFTNLNPGTYTLQIRTLSDDNKQITGERSMSIVIDRPFWRSIWATIAYIMLFVLIGYILFRTYTEKQQKVTQEKFRFIANTAHDIRTPLTLIKAPLEEIREKEYLSQSGAQNIHTAIRNVDILLHMATSLINFEQTKLYSSELYIGEYELNTFMSDIVQSFQSYAEIKKVGLTYESNFRQLLVWFDKEKMESIFKNLISNALKYTPEGGNIHVYVSEFANIWSVKIKDTGMGIPANEQKKIFKERYRGSNAINAQISGSGIGMAIAAKLIQLQKGKVSLHSAEDKGTTIEVTFQKGHEHLDNAHLVFHTSDETPIPSEKAQQLPETGDAPALTLSSLTEARSGSRQRILIVEDDSELRQYLKKVLSEEYVIQLCENGKEALMVIKDYCPDIIISDIMMPEMRGDELCTILKKNIETSHIPIILLTALNDQELIVKSLQIGADEYIVKPFNTDILKATIANILATRIILRNKYANPEMEIEDETGINYNTNIDWKFISDIKYNVEKNMDNPQFNIDTLASLMNMSRTNLYNKIKVLTDLSPSDYVRNIKLDQAAKMLKGGQYSISEIAIKTGFNDAKYFREVFKKHFKVSPSKYKG